MPPSWQTRRAGAPGAGGQTGGGAELAPIGDLELLLGRVLGGSLTEPRALELHERITEVKVRLLNDRVSGRAAWRLAREHGWDTLHDAEYLAVTVP